MVGAGGGDGGGQKCGSPDVGDFPEGGVIGRAIDASPPPTRIGLNLGEAASAVAAGRTSAFVPAWKPSPEVRLKERRKAGLVSAREGEPRPAEAHWASVGSL